MDQLFRLKNTVVEYLSPIAKRRRTIGASTATPAKETEYTFLTPASESTALGRFKDKLYTSPNPRKRGRTEFEGDGSGLFPDDSVSQLSSSEDEAEGSGDAGVHKLEEAIEEDIEEDEAEEEEEEDQDAVA